MSSQAQAMTKGLAGRGTGGAGGRHCWLVVLCQAQGYWPLDVGEPPTNSLQSQEQVLVVPVHVQPQHDSTLQTAATPANPHPLIYTPW